MTKDNIESKVSEAALEYISGHRQDESVVSTISSKNQITLPVHLLRALGLKPGDRVALTQEDGKLILRPRPKDWVGHYAGSLAGIYGQTAGAIEAHIADLRTSDEREEAQKRAWTGRKPAAPD